MRGSERARRLNTFDMGSALDKRGRLPQMKTSAKRIAASLVAILVMAGMANGAFVLGVVHPTSATASNAPRSSVRHLVIDKAKGLKVVKLDYNVGAEPWVPHLDPAEIEDTISVYIAN